MKQKDAIDQAARNLEVQPSYISDKMQNFVMTSKEEIEEESYEALTGTPEEAKKGTRSGATDRKKEKPEDL